MLRTGRRLRLLQDRSGGGGEEPTYIVTPDLSYVYYYLSLLI